MPDFTPYIIAIAAVVVVMAVSGCILLYREEARYRKLLKAHAALAAQASFFENWANSVDDGASQAIVSVDSRGLICGYNPAAARLFGYPSEEIVRRSIFQLIPPDSNKTADTVGPMANLPEREVEAVRNDGTRFSARLRIAHVQAGEESRYRFFFEELKAEQRQRQLEDENQLLRTVVDSTGLVVALLSPQGRILEMSRACADLLEVSPLQAEGRLFWELFQRKEDWLPARTSFERAKGETVPRRTKAEWITRTQRVVPLEWLMLKPERDERGQLIHLIAIAEVGGQAREAEQQRTLKTLERVVGRIAGHFENLLSTINGYSELVHHELPVTNPLRKDLEQIVSASSRASAVMQQLLSYSGNRIMLLEPLKYGSFAVLGNKEGFEEVLWVLAEYGFKVSTEFTSLAETRSTLTGDLEPGDYVSLKMPMGKAIPPEMQDQLFEPFGLGQSDAGLAMVHGIVRSFGGGISISQGADQEAALEILLPAAAKPGEDEVRAEKSTAAVTG